LTVLVLATWVPGLVDLVSSRVAYPWDQAGAFIRETARVRDVVLFRGETEKLDLYPYLSESPLAQSPLLAYPQSVDKGRTDGRVFFVRGEPLLASDHPSQTFGSIQVIIYPRETPENQLIMIRDDIIKNLKMGELSPDLVDDYRYIWEVNKRLNQDDARNFKYYQLYVQCLQLTPRQRNMPLPLLTAAAESALRTDILSGP
jgi:hypothetical protein